MTKQLHIPFYIKLAFIFLSIIAFVFILIIGKNILIPIVYATIIAILLNPLVNFLTKRKVNNVVAIALVAVFGTTLVAVLFYLILSQITSFSDSLPFLKIKIDELTRNLIQWLSKILNVHQSEITTWINTTEKKEFYVFSVTQKFNEISNVLVTVFLLPIYMILILYYKPLFLDFIAKLFRSEHHLAVVEVLTNSKKIIQHYLIGLFFEMIIRFGLNVIGLLMLDMDYVILLAILGALLNIIPFIGGVLGIGIFILVALATKSPIYAVYLIGIFSVIQIIDKNLIVPKIVSSRVKINAFVSLIVVILGGAIWGINGMFLSIPLTAIVKVIFDHIEPLKPWGFVLGNSMSASSKFSFKK